MAEDSSSPDKFTQLDDRVNQLELFTRKMAERLDAIEQGPGQFSSVVSGNPKKWTDELEAHLSRLSAIEAAVETTAPAEKPIREYESRGQITTPIISVNEKRAVEPALHPPLSGGQSAKPPQGPPSALSSQNEQLAKPVPPISAVSSSTEELAPVRKPPTAVVSEVTFVKAPPTAVHPIAQATRAEQMQRTRIARPREASESRPDLESRIGGRWLLWIGVIAISFGMAFFLKYAFDNQWISPGWRVNIGVATGLGFLLGAERLRGRYPIYSNGLSGAGIFILYLSIFVGFNTYALIPQALAFALMAAVTATASLLAARCSALPIAILGLIGGFLTPILLSTGVDNEAGLFGYIALLNAGVLAVAYSKQWRSLNYLAFIATVLMFVGWYETWYTPDKLWTTIFFLTLLFMIFALLAVLHNVVNRRPVRWLDLAMVFANALLYFGSTYELLETNYYGLLGLFAVLVSAFYMGLGYIAFRRDREDSLLIYTFLGLGFLFAVLAVPIQLDQHWVTMGWALEGAALTWIGLKANDKTSRYAALLVFGVALMHWFRTDVTEFAYHANETFLPLLNRRALSCAVFVGALAAAAAFYKRVKSDVQDQERFRFNGLYLLAANALAVFLLNIDVIDYFAQARTAVSDRQALVAVNDTRALTLTALWAIYGAGALFAGVARQIKPLRYLALALLGGATVKVLAVDLNYYAVSWHSLILNQTFAAFAAIVAALALGAWCYARNVEADDEERGIVLPLLLGAANLLAIIALAAEALAYFDRAQALVSGDAVARLENAKQVTLSAVWIIYGAAALIIGIRRRSQAVRVGALILFALAIAKALAVDVRYYNASWHTIFLNPTFMTFGLLIVAFAVGALFYSRAKDIEEQDRVNIIPVLIVAANLLAIVALSAEVVGYFDRAQAIASGDVITRLENVKQLVVSALWTVYGTTALIIGLHRRSRLLRIGSLVLLTLAALKVVAVDVHYYKAPWHMLLVNPTFAAFALLIVGLSACAWFYSRAEGIGDKERRIVVQSLVGAASLLALIGLSAETIGYFEQLKSGAVQLSDQIARLHNHEQFVLSVLWTTFGGAALIAGIKRDLKPFRWGGVILLAVVTFKLVTVDLKYFRAPWHTLIFNETFGVFASLILALATSVWYYTRAEGIDEEERFSIVPLFVVAANVLAVAALSTEVLGYFGKSLRADGVSADDFRNLQFARQLWLSLVWTVYSGAMLTAGIARRSKLLRIMGLSLLGITIFKVFLFDLSSLERLYRTISFIVLGAILLAVSFLYQRYRRQLAEFIDLDGREPVNAESE